MDLSNNLTPSETIITNEELCTLGSRHAVITWTTPQEPADTSLYIGEKSSHLLKHTYALNTEYHWAEIFNLKPDQRYWYQVGSNGVRGPLNSFRTLPQPAGKQLFSFAVISDTHIGYKTSDKTNIYNDLLGHTDELLRQTIQDCQNKDIDLAIMTGDLTDSAKQYQYVTLGKKILPAFGSIPALLIPGNHDKYIKNSGLGAQGFLDYLTNREQAYASVLFKGYHFLLLDSCQQDEDWGYIPDEQLQWLKSMLQKNKGLPAYIFLHHPAAGPDRWYGLKNHRAFLKIIRSYPEVQSVFSGHMHRNQVFYNPLYYLRRQPHLTVPATAQFPCGYAIVRVYEHGYTYNFYKVSRLDLSELLRQRFSHTKWGTAAYTRYTMGRIGDRNFSFSNNLLFKPRQYELAITIDNDKLREVYEKARLAGGVSFAVAEEPDKTKTILGCFDSLQHTALSYWRHNLCTIVQTRIRSI